MTGRRAVVAQCEKPRYESIRKILIPREKDLDIPWSGKIELRRYKPYIVATVTIDDPASMRDGLGKVSQPIYRGHAPVFWIVSPCVQARIECNLAVHGSRKSWHH